MKPMLVNCSLDASRKGQNAVGELMRAVHHGQIRVKRHDFPNFRAAWVLPGDRRRDDFTSDIDILDAFEYAVERYMGKY